MQANFPFSRQRQSRLGCTLLLILVFGVPVLSSSLSNAADGRNWRQSALRSPTPDDEIVRLDIDQDGKIDILERWWNGKRCRWLDEGGTLRPTDTRGDQVNSVLQVDMDGDGFYDGPTDMNIKWCDTDNDGIPDVQAFAINAKQWTAQKVDNGHGHWMLFLNPDKRAALGWVDWARFNFDCWGHTDQCNWLPNYHNGDFLKVHAPAFSLEDPRMNWENPFSFYDFDNDGCPEMAMRWCDPPRREGLVTKLQGAYVEAYVTFDLDNDSGKGNETDFDLSLRGGTDADALVLPYRQHVHPLPHFKGNPKFDPCFQYNNWRRISEVQYMPRDKGYDAFFTANWKRMYFVFDEDDDDHRWERVELLYPNGGYPPSNLPIDIYSTRRWKRDKSAATAKDLPGLCGHPQSDTLGDRGEFDTDNSGRGKLYIGVFDRKLHLYGAEWGAWTVDKNAEFHAGVAAPVVKPAATNVEEVVKYTDTDNNGYLDTIEYDYDGDRTIDFKVCLLDYKTAKNPHPDVAPVIDTRKEGWKGLHELFNKMSLDAWIEAHKVYRAAWQRGLTTPELDTLANASSNAQRYHNAYWIKEKVFRIVRERLASTRSASAASSASLDKLEKDLTRTYYTGQFDAYVELLAQVPGQ